MLVVEHGDRVTQVHHARDAAVDRPQQHLLQDVRGQVVDVDDVGHTSGDQLGGHLGGRLIGIGSVEHSDHRNVAQVLDQAAGRGDRARPVAEQDADRERDDPGIGWPAQRGSSP